MFLPLGKMTSQEMILEEEKNESSFSSSKHSSENENQIKTAREEARIKIDDILEQNRLNLIQEQESIIDNAIDKDNLTFK